jgi:hypothetical protein
LGGSAVIEGSFEILLLFVVILAATFVFSMAVGLVFSIVFFVRRGKSQKRKDVWQPASSTSERQQAPAGTRRKPLAVILFSCGLVLSAAVLALVYPVASDLHMFNALFPGGGATRYQQDAVEYIEAKYGFEPTEVESEELGKAGIFSSGSSACYYTMEHDGRQFTCLYQYPRSYDPDLPHGALCDDYQRDEIHSAFMQLAEQATASEVLGIDLYYSDDASRGYMLNAKFEGDTSVIFNYGTKAELYNVFTIHLSEKADYNAILSAAQSGQLREKFYDTEALGQLPEQPDANDNRVTLSGSFLIWRSADEYNKATEAIAARVAVSPSPKTSNPFLMRLFWLKDYYVNLRGIVYWPNFRAEVIGIDLREAASPGEILCLDEDINRYAPQEDAGYLPDMAKVEAFASIDKIHEFVPLTPAYSLVPVGSATRDPDSDVLFYIPEDLPQLAGRAAADVQLVIVNSNGECHAERIDSHDAGFLYVAVTDESHIGNLKDARIFVIGRQ